MSTTFKEQISEKAFYQVAYPMIVFPSILVLARTGMQFWKRKRMELQDYLIYFAFVCFLAMSISYLVVIPKIYAIGMVRAGLIKPWPSFKDDRIMYIRMMFVTNTLFWLCLWSVKLSLLGLYKKLLEGLPQTLAGCIVSYITSCPDFAASLSKGECAGPRSVRGQLASLYMSYTVDVLSDFMIMALPIKLVWNLQMARGQKIAIIALFASAFICICFATLRVSQIGIKAGNNSSPSPSWLALWTIIESAMAVCIGCGPAFAFVYRTSRTTHTSRDTQGYVRHDQSQSGGNKNHLLLVPGGKPIKMNFVTIGAARSRASKMDRNVYSDSAMSSQEELAANRIVVTTTVQQDNVGESDMGRR